MGFQDSMTGAECCILLAFLIIPYTDAQSWPSDVQQPANPTIVVEGVNSSEVSLVWGSPAKQGDIVVQVVIERGRPGGNQREAIALKIGANAFNVQPGFERDYVALLPLTLELRNVDNNEEYDYFVTFTYTPKDGSLLIVKSQIRVIVNVPPRITKEPARNSRVNLGQNLTLTCNASGDPMPNITWSKEGATTNQLVNATGYKLTLVNVQRKDVGSYKCTVNNGYGTASSLAIVNMICSQCNTTTVGITIREGAVWRDSLRNRESLEFKMLASNLTSAIVAPYSQPGNEGKQLYEVAIKEFRPGSVIAVVQMQFPRGISDPLQPLRSEINDERLGIFTVNRELDLNPSKPTIKTAVASATKSWIGQMVQLTCEADGRPTPTITWKRQDGSKVKEVTATRNIASVEMKTEGDFGTYTCETQNLFGLAAAQRVEIKEIKEPGSPIITSTAADIQATSLTVKWNVPTTNGGSPITAYRVVILRGGNVIRNENFTDLNLPKEKLIEGLDISANYIVRVYARNFVFEGEPGEKMIRTKFQGSSCGSLHAAYVSVIVVLLIIIVLLSVMLWRLRRSHSDKCRRCGSLIAMDPLGNQSTGNTNLSTVAQTNDTQTYATPIGGDYMPLHPPTRSWEIMREQVDIIKVIGKGAFSQVTKATVKNVRGYQEYITVAVKMLKANAPASDRKDLLSELELMKKLKPHPHVIKLVGCVTQSDPLLVLIEYVPFGDLLGYLRKSRGLTDRYYKDPDVTPQTTLTAEQLMRFAWQVADGMCYLSSRKIIHRDLAARNVLVGEGEKCKVTDFGMARNVQQDDIYNIKNRASCKVDCL